MMDHKIFYSWQSDLPTRTNEQFIEGALKSVIQKLKDDSSLDVNPILDRDIANMPESPDVAATILTKIEQSDIFVGDVSIINKKQAKKIRLTSNPNVLVELGYALKALGPDKIILVNNLAYGKHEDLPFDFRHKHVVGYSLSQDDINGKYDEERQTLEMQLEQKLRQIIFSLKRTSSQKSTPCDEAISAIKNMRPNQAMLISDFIDWMLNELEKCSPPFPNVEGNELDSILAGIDRTVELVSDFTRLFSVIANFSSAELPLFYKRIFERILVKYNPPVDFTGSSYVGARMQFYKFIGHELFVTLIAILLDAEKLDIMADILDEALYVENDLYLYAGPQNVSFTYISMTGESSRGIRKPMIDSLAEKLSQRHSEGKTAGFMPMTKIVEADYFLSLRKGQIRWDPIITNRLDQLPKFLIRAYKQKYAHKLLRPFAVNSVDEMKGLVSSQSERGFLLKMRFNFDVNKIGSE
jgi:hypothetical protein